MKTNFKLLLFAAASSLLISCGGVAPIVSTPIENIDAIPLKVAGITDDELKIWWHLDLEKDTIPGMSVIRTYDEIIKKRKGETVIVGVIDSGIDTEHEDLKNVLWVNKKEIPGNGIDDDNNGYIDDIHGWNFLGDIVGENLEFVRIMRRLEPRFEGKDESAVSTADREDYELYKKAKAEFLKEKQDALQNKMQYEMIYDQLQSSHQTVTEELGKEDYTAEDLESLSDAEFPQEKAMLGYMLSFGDSIPEILKQLKGGVDYFTQQLEHHLDAETDYRTTLGDDPYDITDTGHGNNQVSGPDPEKKDAKHGTHVAGIIAAERNNSIGMNGVANNVQVMVLRAVPDGDEYDKDIALAIRYAVDNGAKVINTSFGKYYSQNPEWVYDAIKYAAEHDVLIVNAAGNDAYDLDEDYTVFPNDQTDNYSEIADNFITIGALNYKYGSEMVAVFSNYGKSNVDIFAPGVKIYAPTPNNEYEFLDGTSMASPAAAGVAVMLRSYYPQLTASQVKKIIMDSGLPVKTPVILGGEEENIKPFSEISKSGKIVNMYNAFIMAEQFVK